MSEETVLVKPQDRLVFVDDDDQHLYLLDGKPVRSVTGYLRHVNLVNFDRVPPNILKEALLRGTKVHRAVHCYNVNTLKILEFCRLLPHYAGYLQSWVRLMATGRLQTVLSEHRVACDNPRFAGTFDWLGLFDGKPAIIDFATGHPRDAWKQLQTAAYLLAAEAWKEQPGEETLKAFLDAYPYVHRYSVRLNKEGRLPKPLRYEDPKDVNLVRDLIAEVNTLDALKPKTAHWNWKDDEDEAAA